MQRGYLQYVKNIAYESAVQPNAYRFFGSGIYMPFGKLVRDLGKYPVSLFKAVKSPNYNGHEQLRTAISQRYEVPFDNLLITPGASQAMWMVCCTLLKPNMRVIFELPGYETIYSVVATIVGTENISFLERRKDDYQIDLEQLEEKIKSDGKNPVASMIILTNPNNPTGALLKDETLKEIVSVARKYGTRVLIDEIFLDFVNPWQKTAALLGDNVVSINSLSKVFTDVLRCGWITASQEVIHQIWASYLLIHNIGSPITESLSSVLIRYLANSYRERAILLANQNRKLLTNIFTPLLESQILEGVIPEYGVLYYPRITKLEDTSKFVRELQEKYGVWVAPGGFFGNPQHVRLGFGGESARLERGLEIFADALRKLGS